MFDFSAGFLGLPRPRDSEPQHGGAHATHFRRGAAADLHPHAPRLVPALRELSSLQGSGAHVGRLSFRAARSERSEHTERVRWRRQVTPASPRAMIRTACLLSCK